MTPVPVPRPVRTAVAALAALAVLAPGAAAADRSTLDPDDPRLLVQTYDATFLTVDPRVKDPCQHERVGNSAGQTYGNIATTPDGTVYGTIWDEDITTFNPLAEQGDSTLVRVGRYVPNAVGWTGRPRKIGSRPKDYQAGLVAESNEFLVSASYHHRTLWRVNTATGVFTELGRAPALSAGDMAWAGNGDLLFSGRDGHIYRLPRADYVAAAKGARLEQDQWFDMGGVKGSSGWLASSDSNLYGLATDADGRTLVANKGGGIAHLDRSADPDGDDVPFFAPVLETFFGSDELILDPIRDLGRCGLPNGQIMGMTSPNETLWAPAEPTDPETVQGVPGRPLSARVTTTAVAGPLTVRAARSALPPGVRLAADGTLTGTPLRAGTRVAAFKICGPKACVWKDVTFVFRERATGVAQDGSTAQLPTRLEVTDPAKLPPGVKVEGGKLTGSPTVPKGEYDVPVHACGGDRCEDGILHISVGRSGVTARLSLGGHRLTTTLSLTMFQSVSKWTQ